MAKIGRNQPCPCGSGLKYKKCCLPIASKTGGQPTRQQITIAEEVAQLQEAAAAGKAGLKTVGVFILFATADGDAWLLEATENDALLVCREGQKLPVRIAENEEDIEIRWSHRFQVDGDYLETTAYADGVVERRDNYPIAAIESAIKGIKKTFSANLIDGLHIRS